MRYLSLVILLTMVLASISLSTKVLAVQANITDIKGIKTKAHDLKYSVVTNCGDSRYYKGIPTSSEYYWDSLPLNTGNYTVWIAFVIINRVTVQKYDSISVKYGALLHGGISLSSMPETVKYTVFLSDKTVITGEPEFINSFFEATTDTGSFKIHTLDIKEINFTNKSKLSFNSTPNGKNLATSALADDN